MEPDPRSLLRHLQRWLLAIILVPEFLLGAFGLWWTFTAAIKAPRSAGLDWFTSLLYRMYGPPNFAALTSTFLLVLSAAGIVSIMGVPRRRQREWPS
jgi:hypothetical protein